MFNDCNILSTEDRTTDQYFPDKARIAYVGAKKKFIPCTGTSRQVSKDEHLLALSLAGACNPYS